MNCFARDNQEDRMKVSILRRLKSIDRITAFGDSIGNRRLGICSQAVHFRSKDMSFQRTTRFSSSVIVERFNREDTVIKKSYRKGVNRRIISAKILKSELFTNLPLADIHASMEPSLRINWRNMPLWIIIDSFFWKSSRSQKYQYPIVRPLQIHETPFRVHRKSQNDTHTDSRNDDD